MHKLGNVLKAIESHTLKGWILWYANYLLMRKNGAVSGLRGGNQILEEELQKLSVWTTAQIEVTSIVYSATNEERG